MQGKGTPLCTHSLLDEGIVKVKVILALGKLFVVFSCNICFRTWNVPNPNLIVGKMHPEFHSSVQCIIQG